MSRLSSLSLLSFALLLTLTGCGGGSPAGDRRGGAEGAEGRDGMPGVGEPRIELLRGQEPRERILVGDGGLAVGSVGGPLIRLLFSSPGRVSDLRSLLQTYKPFQAHAPEGELVFRGRGAAVAGPVERRMILEWVRQVAAEAAGGRTSAAFGLALAWHRGAGPGNCDDVSVYLTGEVQASSCASKAAVSGHLAPGPLGQLYGWFDRLKPLQVSGSVTEGRTESSMRLIFAGHGPAAASPADLQALQAFALELQRELAVRRGGPAAPAPVPVNGKGKAAAAESTVLPGPSGPGLLLPPRPPGRSLREVIIPEERMPPPPPVPREPAGEESPLPL